jgi:hypothetical protein
VTERRFLVKADEIAERASVVSHPWNPNSEIVGTRLGVLAGLSRIGVNRARIPGGKESFIYHSRHTLASTCQHDEVVALSSKRLPLEPAVDGLDLEPRQPEHKP